MAVLGRAADRRPLGRRMLYRWLHAAFPCRRSPGGKQARAIGTKRSNGARACAARVISNMVMLVLFHGDTSTASAKVRLALAEKRLSFESRLFVLRRGEHRNAEYLAINPAGVVPTLVHNGCVIVESSVILEYVEEAFSEPPLLPASLSERARTRALMRDADHLHDACSVLSSVVKLAPMRDDTAAVSAALARVADPLKRERQARLVAQGFDAPDIRTPSRATAHRSIPQRTSRLRRGFQARTSGSPIARCCPSSIARTTSASPNSGLIVPRSPNGSRGCARGRVLRPPYRRSRPRRLTGRRPNWLLARGGTNRPDSGFPQRARPGKT